MLNLKGVECVGCTACSSICPVNVLDMATDAEGFLRPIIINPEKCIDCALCEKVCPVKNNQKEKVFTQLGAIVQIKNAEIRKESTSGGMFSAISLSVLRQGGVVFGVAYDEEFHVKHICVDNEKDLSKLRGSKYVQSNLIGTFRKVKSYLNEKRQVCFSGTPCQIEGLQRFLQKDYDNLILVDVVCHGVSSPLIWEKYLENIQKYNTDKIYFRWKHYGYKYSTMSFFSKDNREVYFSGVESDKMLRAYFSNGCDRETCYNCDFKKRYRTSDFTIWDCFQPKIYDKEFDDDLGTSCVLGHTEKAKKIFNELVSDDIIRSCIVDPDELVFGNNEMISSVKRNPIRGTILKDAALMNSQQLFNKYFPDNLKQKTKKCVRLFLVKIGLYGFIKYRLFVHRRKKLKKEER